MVRIKYTEYGNQLVTDWFTLGPNLIVRGVIDTETLLYKIIEFDSGIFREGGASSLRVAKDRIRALLTESGVQFDGEMRKGRKYDT